MIAGPAYASVGRAWRLSPAERAAAYAQLRESLAPIVEYAGAAGVTVAVEPLNRYETSLLNTIGQTLEAIGDLPHCGVALDLYHQNIEETDISAAIRAAAGRVAHVQVCGNDRGTPGADHLDWPAILAAVDEAGYAGPVVHRVVHGGERVDRDRRLHLASARRKPGRDRRRRAEVPAGGDASQGLTK